ncbi:MAG: hypothetical protein D3903_18930 [Candidatus Electrothrix sp. GM3_4]|nr:hypothetical protein [Candidatus Electrothrix sp. GM3_4]
MYQASTIDALLSGVLDGDLAISDLAKHGDFGIGTFDKLDGEMLLLDGEIYQVRADGKIYRPKLSNKTPFATVCNFTSEQNFSVPAGTDYPALEKLIDRHAPNRNVFYAIKLTGKFKNITTRSVPAQKKTVSTVKRDSKASTKISHGECHGYTCRFPVSSVCKRS